MIPERVTVFGGSGFLGREIVRRLAAAGVSVRVAVRRPPESQRGGAPGIVECVRADVCDADSVRAAVADAGAVVNAVGLYVERGDARFEAVHVDGAGRVARESAHAGATRLVHVSGIGADAASASAYVRARGLGEQVVRAAFAAASVLRPAVIFGPGDAMCTSLARIARRAPVLPLFGCGTTRLQPVYVGDVAEAAVRALGEPAAAGAVYELGGPRVYRYRELVEIVLTAAGRRRPLLPLPYPLWELQATLLGALPNPPLTRDQVELMKHDTVVGEGVLGLADLGIEATPLESVLPQYIGGV